MTTQNLKTFVKNSNVDWESAGEGIRRKILGYDEGLMLVLVEFQEGAIGHVHQHPHRQVSYVVEGSFEVEIDDQKQILRQGDSFFVPSESPHGAVALEPGILVDTFAPMREDYVPNGQS
jgi:quercetin dioxygenase-like cupin family protein